MVPKESITTNGLLRVSEAASLLGIKPGTLRVWLRQRRIGYVRLSARAVRLRRADVEKAIGDRLITAKGTARARAKSAAA